MKIQKRSSLFFSLACYLSLLCSISCQNQERTEDTQTNTDSSDTLQDDQASENQNSDKIILFFGNSITAGYGLEEEEAYPALIQEKIDSLNLSYKVVNAGISGETTAAGLERIDWVLEQKISVFVLELGGNDGLRGLDLQETKKNLKAIIDKVKAKYPDVKILLTGIEVPPNMGEDYVRTFRQVFPEVAQEKEVAFLPFILQEVAGEPEFNQDDGIHPTAEGHQIVARNVWAVLKDLL